MQLSEEAGGSAQEGEGEAVVMVGVKLDGESRELLTWALVKVAKPGDRVVALHVIDSSTTFAVEGTSSLLALVKAFDSVLSVYEGFCNLKQVELKLKVCRGRTARSALVQEAKACGSTKVILGISKGSHTIRSPSSVAKYCARNLPCSFSVFAVDNGKVVFKRDAAGTGLGHKKDEHRFRDYVRLLPSRKVLEKYNSSNTGCLHQSNSLCGAQNGCRKSGLPKASTVCHSGDENGNDAADNTLALVPFQQNLAGSISDSHGNRGRWVFLQHILLKRQNPEKSSGKNSAAQQRVSRPPNMQSSAAVHPDEKQCTCIESDARTLDGESGAIVPVDLEDAECPLSPSRWSKSIPKELEGLYEKYSSTCRLFTHEELSVATSGFVPENMIGRGGCSRVYSGCLPDGKELAVKVFLRQSQDVLKEFMMEIEIITTLHHSNIISLFGYCCEYNNLILVYDFLHRGSLEENLHGDKKKVNDFGWRERYKVALGVAEALKYMHKEIDQPVIHKDVKSSNILLADDFEPQLSDFGLACRVPDFSCQLTSDDVVGTFGYLAPEYFMHGKVSDKIDVYAFGVVILELLSGRKSIDGECLKGQESLVMWANPILKTGKVSELLDPSLDSNYDHEHIGRMVMAATLCIRRSPRYRPQISTVLKLLQGDEEIVNWVRQQISSTTDIDDMDDEDSPINIQSHLNLALQGLEDDTMSASSSERSTLSDNYLEQRWSRTSSLETTDHWD